MTTIEIVYKPGDTIEYHSSRYGRARMQIREVKFIWDKYSHKVAYKGYPEYLDLPEKQRRYMGSVKVAVTKLSNIKLIKEGKENEYYKPELR